MIVGIHHVAIGVPDFDAGLAFYRDALGFEVVQESSWNGDHPLADAAIGLPVPPRAWRMLKAANAYIELWQYTAPEPADRRSRPCDYGYPHLCLQVDGIAEEHARLGELGMEFMGPPSTSSPYPPSTARTLSATS